MTCDCTDSLCRGSLGFHRGQDPPLYDLYARKLLIRGWAGIPAHGSERILPYSVGIAIKQDREHAHGKGDWFWLIRDEM